MPQNRLIDELFLGTVTVGERGQIVIPAELRKQSSIEAGDKLLCAGAPHKEGVAFVKLSGLAALLDVLEAAQNFSDVNGNAEDDETVVD